MAEEYAAASNRSAWLADHGCDSNGNPAWATASVAPPPRAQTVCQEVPRYETRVVPLDGERVAPACEGCTEQVLCTYVEVLRSEQCAEQSEEQWATWRESRTQQIEVGTERRCEEVSDAPEQPAPAVRGYRGGGPVHVRGYYRNGTYVRPHTRSRPRR